MAKRDERKSMIGAYVPKYVADRLKNMTLKEKISVSSLLTKILKEEFKADKPYIGPSSLDFRKK